MMKVLRMSGDVVVKNYRVRRDDTINIMIVASGLAIQNFKGFGTRKTVGERTIYYNKRPNFAIRKKVRIGTGVFEKRPRWGESFFV